METNTIIGMVGVLCIAFSLVFLLVIGAVTVIKKAKRMYQAGTEQYITTSQYKELHEQNVAINNKLNKLGKPKE